MSGKGGKSGAAIEEAFRFVTEIAIIEQLAGAAMEKVMPADMTRPQFDVLNHLARLGGEWTPLRLAAAMQVTKGTMTNTLGHLGDKGFVAIRPDDKDGRSKLVSLTEPGRAARDRRSSCASSFPGWKRCGSFSTKGARAEPLTARGGLG
jgi:DNA-binding MarR family transcriptional regulator